MWSSDVDTRRRSALRLAAAAAVGTGLAGCGFRLRQAPQFAFRRIAITGFQAGSPMADELRRALRDTGRLDVVALPAQAEVVFESLGDQREKVVVALTAAGQVREFELRSRLNFRVLTPTGRLLIEPAELRQVRSLSYSESLALAKEHEERLLQRSMQTDIVDQVMRRLASLPAV